MEIYLIRHGETVDNVAGLYAGVRDSALTNHGAEQARRLGEYFCEKRVHFTHIFSSPLSRAMKTAEAISSAQIRQVPPSAASTAPGDSVALDARIVVVQDLIEQDFGYYEGKSFHVRTVANKSGRDAHRESHKNEPGFVDVESKPSMMKRADAFLDDHLMPLFREDGVSSGARTIAVVSHGMLLSTLWKRILARLPKKSVAVAPAVVATRDNMVLEHLGGWSNTGYLHLSFSAIHEAPAAAVTTPVDKTEPPSRQSASFDAAKLESPIRASTAVADVRGSPLILGRSMIIQAVDSKEHLSGLKRQRGGIGSAAYDKGQKKLDGFFKRQRQQ